jgi:hypothetical protein
MGSYCGARRGNRLLNVLEKVTRTRIVSDVSCLGTYISDMQAPRGLHDKATSSDRCSRRSGLRTGGYQASGAGANVRTPTANRLHICGLFAGPPRLPSGKRSDLVGKRDRLRRGGLPGWYEVRASLAHTTGKVRPLGECRLPVTGSKCAIQTAQQPNALPTKRR